MRRLLGAILWAVAMKLLPEPRRKPDYSDIALTARDAEREHIDGPNCWCQPDLFFDGGDDFGDVWVHKGNGEELPPAKVLIEAIADAMRKQ